MTIEAIIFDKDGTLFDFRRTWEVWAERVLEELSDGDTDRRQALSQAIGYDSKQGFHPSSVVIAGTSAEVGDALSSVLGRRPGEVITVVDRIAASTPQQEVPGLASTLAVLARRHKLGVVTNDAEVPARVHLSAVGITEHFDFIAGYDSGHGAKPAPGPLLAFSAATGTRPARTLMVGDSRHDLTAGRAAGMETIGVLTGIAVADDLADLADAILPDISHLPDWIATRA